MEKSARFILLHARCMMRRPQNWRFHAAGIAREITRCAVRLADGRKVTSEWNPAADYPR